MTDLEALADTLDRAVRTREACAQLSDRAPLPLASAYEVQRAVVARRLGRGAATVGAKLGFTSRSKAEQMGVDDVIIGRLTSDMLVDDGAEIDLADFVHPRVEPEVAFLLGDDLAVEAVAPALEIIDSRYRDFRFDLGDVVADNTSAAGFVLGPWRSWSAEEARLGDRDVRLSVDGRTAATGSTAAILGDPRRAVPTAARLAGRFGIGLHRGDVLLAGAATAAVALTPGTAVEAEVSGLGRVRVSITGTPDGGGR